MTSDSSVSSSEYIMVASRFRDISDPMNIDNVSIMVSAIRLVDAVMHNTPVMINTKNAGAPEGKHWDLSTNSYVDNPTCEPGYHWSMDEYKCVPD